MPPRMIQVNISLTPNAAASIASTVAALEATGLENVSVLEAIGVVTGSIAEDRIPKLGSIPGVVVERGEVIHIAPPDAPIK